MKQWKYEPGTKTIRSVPENYWIATMDSWDGAVNHEANAKLIASAPDLLEACKFAFEHLGPKGNVKKDFSGHNAMATLSRAIKRATE